MPNYAEVEKEAQFELKLKGKQVCLRYAGREHYLKLSRGLRLWAELINHPGIPISFAQLDSALWNDPQAVGNELPLAELKELEFGVQSDFPCLEMVDLRTVKEVKERLNEIILQLAELEHYHDYARQDDLLEEKDKLVNYLTQVYSPAGKLARFPSESRKCERRVMKALQRALRDIAEMEPSLAIELKKSLNKGSTLTYLPGRAF